MRRRRGWAGACPIRSSLLDRAASDLLLSRLLTCSQKYGAGYLNYNATSLAPLTFSPVGYSTTAYTLTYTGGAPPFAGGAAQCTNSYSMGPYVAPPPVVTSTFTFPVNLSTFDADTISSGVSAAYAGVGTPGAPMVALGVQSTAYASGGVVAPSGVAPSGVAPPDPCAQMVCGGALCGAAVAQFLGMPPHVVIGITMGLSACGGGGVGGIFTPSFDIPPSWQSAGRRSLAQAAGGGGAALYFQVFGLGANATAARAAAAGLSDPAVLNAALAAAGLNTTVTSAPPAVVTAAVSVAVSLPRGASQSNALAALAAVNSGASFSSVLAAGGGAGPATTTNAVPPPAPPPVAPPTPSKAMRARKNPRKGLAPYNDGYNALSLDYWASVGACPAWPLVHLHEFLFLPSLRLRSDACCGCGIVTLLRGMVPRFAPLLHDFRATPHAHMFLSPNQGFSPSSAPCSPCSSSSSPSRGSPCGCCAAAAAAAGAAPPAARARSPQSAPPRPRRPRSSTSARCASRSSRSPSYRRALSPAARACGAAGAISTRR